MRGAFHQCVLRRGGARLLEGTFFFRRAADHGWFGFGQAFINHKGLFATEQLQSQTVKKFNLLQMVANNCRNHLAMRLQNYAVWFRKLLFPKVHPTTVAFAESPKLK
jgi:hypothetical protein